MKVPARKPLRIPISRDQAAATVKAIAASRRQAIQTLRNMSGACAQALLADQAAAATGKTANATVAVPSDVAAILAGCLAHVLYEIEDGRAEPSVIMLA